MRLQCLRMAATIALGLEFAVAESAASQLRPTVDAQRLRLITDTLVVTRIAEGQPAPAGIAISSLRSSEAGELELTFRWLLNSGDSLVVVASLDYRSLRPVV